MFMSAPPRVNQLRRAYFPSLKVIKGYVDKRAAV
nr:MAG TPA: hypothetical protein [Caudoviricetes sp.]